MNRTLVRLLVAYAVLRLLLEGIGQVVNYVMPRWPADTVQLEIITALILLAVLAISSHEERLINKENA